MDSGSQVMTDASGDSDGPEAFEYEITAVPTHGGAYVCYNIYGNAFEVTARYIPPIRPIGRGAYGVVWYDETDQGC